MIKLTRQFYRDGLISSNVSFDGRKYFFQNIRDRWKLPGRIDEISQSVGRMEWRVELLDKKLGRLTTKELSSSKGGSSFVMIKAASLVVSLIARAIIGSNFYNLFK